jgi:hypothetical protein
MGRQEEEDPVHTKRWRTVGAAAGLVLAVGLVGGGAAGVARADLGQHDGSINTFIRSASESADQTQVTFPLHRGTSHGQTVWYVVTDAADRGYANSHGVNYVPKLEAAKGTAAVQTVSVNRDGSVDFPGTVHFGLGRSLTPGCTPTCATNPLAAFPPSAFHWPAEGDAQYSPLIQLPDGTVLNAPQVANPSGQADKVLALDPAHGTVRYKETEGRYDNRVVHYVSFDASNPLAAALEDVTYAPNLGAAPGPDCSVLSTTPCAREGLIAFTNGQVGAANPQRQGVSSAILDGQSPLNILQEIPEGQADPGFPAYSPLWDIHLATWTPAAVAAGQNSRQADFGTARNLATAGGPVGTFPDLAQPLKAAGFVVNCPAVSLNPSK